MSMEDKNPGFNLTRFFENLSFNLISRGVGFVVRVVLIITGIFSTIVAFILGIMLILAWVTIPLIGIPFYFKYISRHEISVRKLLARLVTEKRDILGVLLSGEAGKFLLTHIGVDFKTLTDGAKKDVVIKDLTGCKSYREIIERFVTSGVWESDFLRSVGVTKEDIALAASWWDRNKIEKTKPASLSNFQRPGVGLELLFGYTPTLNQYSIDLSTPQSFSHHLIGRENIVLNMERILDAGNSIALTGAPGVGKKTVVLEFAKRAAFGQLGQKMAYRRILELDYNSLLAGSGDVNDKKTKLSYVLEEAARAGNIILVVRDIHRITNSSVEGFDFTDVFESLLEGRELKIIAISTAVDYERFISPNLRLRKFLEKLEVVPPSKSDALLIIRDSADFWEKRSGKTITVQAIRRILEGSDKYISETPFPEKALEVLDAVVEFESKNEDGVITESDVNVVISEKTGISFARLTEKEKDLLTDLENIIHKKLINQESAVSLIAKSLRARSVGVTKEDRPVGSFLFLGPTGVGKTETAKVLARIYYGSEEAMIRFDMAQFSGQDSLERLIGSVRDGRPGDLVTAIKNKPASLLLLDEIEKGSREVHNLLLTILDEGYLVDAFGKKINCKHLFLIGTSNAAAEYIRELVGRGVPAEQMQRDVVEYTLQKGLFYPEFLNRFDGVVVYEPLSLGNLEKVSKLMLDSLKENLEKKGVYLEVPIEAIKKLAKDGYEPSFGARPMRRIVDLILGDLFGRAILSGELKEGDKVRLLATDKVKEFSWEKI